MRTALPVLLVPVALAACGVRDTAEIETDSYVAVRALLPEGVTDDGLMDVTLDLDRELGTATFTEPEGDPVVVDLVTLDREAWPLDCPTMTSSVRVELVLLDTDAITLSETSFEDPALVAGCSMSGGAPEVVLTHADDQDTGARSSCGPSPCLTFEVDDG